MKNLYMLLILFCLSSCMNQYEKQVAGKYELYNYEAADKNVDVFSKLKLHCDKTFELQYGGKKISGNWSADDNGDATIIEFTYRNRITQAQVGRDEISFYSLNGFGIENLTDIKFLKIE